MSERNLQLARDGLAAFNRGDFDALDAVLADDVVAVVPAGMPNEGTYEGREGYWLMLRHWIEAWEDFRAEAHDFIAIGDHVVVPVRQVGRGRGSGVEVSAEMAYLLELRDGLLVRWQLCLDREEALAAARAAG
jgi:ketosteroid isomerase-like protein